MRKVIKIGFPIICVVLIGGTFIMLGKLDRKVEGSLKNKDYSNSVNKAQNNSTQNESLDENEVITYTVPVEEDSENELENNTTNNIN